MRYSIGLLLIFTLLAPPAVAAPDGAIAVVVNKGNAIDNLSGKELKAAYEGYGLPGSKDQNIAIVYLRGDIENKFNLKVLGISSKKVKVYWLKRVFAGESDLRKILKTAAEVKAFIGQNETAIGFIPAADLDDSVKPISIDAKKHDDPAYKIQ
jgi:ABC-type phosphate transport system substrate-binding protein